MIEFLKGSPKLTKALLWTLRWGGDGWHLYTNILYTCSLCPLVLLLLIHNIFIPSVFLMKLQWHVWKWLQKIILYSLFQCIFLGEYEVSQKTSISHYSPYHNKKAILLKKSHHHHNIPLSLYLHTGTNGMTHKPHKTYTEAKKGRCPDFYDNHDTSLVHFML